MRERCFRAHLSPRLGASSIDSYVAYARRVEMLLGIDFDTADLSGGFDGLASRLRASGIPCASVAHSLTVLRSYARFQDGNPQMASFERGLSAPPEMPPARAEAGVDARAFALRSLSITGLLRLQAEAVEELRARGVVRTGNGPLGDYAEMLFARAFGWTLEGNSSSGHDASDLEGVRYQIKARRIGPRNPSRQLGALRRLDDENFDVLAVVLFDERFLVMRAALIPFSVASTLARRTEHTNSWRIILSDRVWAIAGVVDVTREMRAAADADHA